MALINLNLAPITAPIIIRLVPAMQTDNPDIKKEPEDFPECSATAIKEEPNSPDDKDWSEIPVKEEPEEINLDRPSATKIHNCDHCSYTTGWKGNLTKHVVSRHTSSEEIQWLQCDHCAYKGKTKDYLKCHLLHVHNVSVKWFDCPTCPFKAKLKSHLDRHVIVNHAEKEEIQWHQCEQCPYKAKLKTNLKQHVLNKHTDSSRIQWFECDQCDFKAKRKRYLKLHQVNKHTNEDEINWFRCELCPYKFKRKPSLKLHVSLVHNKKKMQTKEIPVFVENRLVWKRVVVEEEQEGAFKCNQCTFESHDKELFKNHVLKMHVVTELKQEDDGIVKKTYKTRDVVVLVDNAPCVKRVVEHSL